MCGKVGNEKYLPLAIFSEAVYNLETFHPLDDGTLMALLRDVHLPGHAVVEQLGSDDGELLEGGVPDGEDLDLVMVHLSARFE